MRQHLCESMEDKGRMASLVQRNAGDLQDSKRSCVKV